MTTATATHSPVAATRRTRGAQLPALVGRQLRHHATLLAGACAGLFGFELLLVWISASIGMGPEFRELLEVVLPPAMQDLVLNQFGIASFAASVAFGFKHPFVIAAAAAVVITIGSIPAGERESGVLDLILARPVRRATYTAAHVLLLAVPVLAFPLVIFAGAATGIALAGRADAAPLDYVAPAAALAPLLLVIGAYTLLFATTAQRRGIAVARAAALTLAFFVYDVVAAMWDRLRGWEWLTIFDAYQPVGIVTGEAGARAPLLLLALAAALLGLAAIRFDRS